MTRTVAPNVSRGVPVYQVVDEIVQLAGNSIEASFLPEPEKESWLGKIRRFDGDASLASG